ncbi:hypothetical protein [Paenibacillus sp. NPDC055715]
MIFFEIEAMKVFGGTVNLDEDTNGYYSCKVIDTCRPMSERFQLTIEEYEDFLIDIIPVVALRVSQDNQRQVLMEIRESHRDHRWLS